VVEHKGHILLIKEKEGKQSYYSLPGGGVEYLETIPEATKREVWEETGLLVDFVRLLWIDERIDKSSPGKHTVGIGVLAALVGEESTPIPGGVEDEEILWSGWVSLEQFRSLQQFNLSRRDQVVKALSEPGYVPDYIGNILHGS
jgi:ADP-ribose pyrophosphatase YjhB (NUDIX family)